MHPASRNEQQTPLDEFLNSRFDTPCKSSEFVFVFRIDAVHESTDTGF